MGMGVLAHRVECGCVGLCLSCPKQPVKAKQIQNREEEKGRSEFARVVRGAE